MAEDKGYDTMDGHIHLYKIKGTSQYQFRLKLPDGKWMQVTAGKVDLQEAAQVAMRNLITLRVKIEAGIPTQRKRFRDIAHLAIKELEAKLESGEADPVTTRVKIENINRFSFRSSGITILKVSQTT